MMNTKNTGYPVCNTQIIGAVP